MRSVAPSCEGPEGKQDTASLQIQPAGLDLEPETLSPPAPHLPSLSPHCIPCPFPADWVTARGKVWGHALPQASLVPTPHGLGPQVPRGGHSWLLSGPLVWGLTVSTEYSSEPSEQLLSAGRAQASVIMGSSASRRCPPNTT